MSEAAFVRGQHQHALYAAHFTSLAQPRAGAGCVC